MSRGIVRKIDELGRVTLPIEYRKSFGIATRENAPIGMYVDGQVIRLHMAEDRFLGIVRKLDELGRLTLPIEVRRTLDFEDRQDVDLYVDGGEVCIGKYTREDVCVICGDGGEDLHEVKGKFICEDCALAVYDAVIGG